MLLDLVEKTKQTYNFGKLYLLLLTWSLDVQWGTWHQICFGCQFDIIIDLFEAFETLKQTLTKTLQDLSKQYGLTKKSLWKMRTLN
jgi:hypothetical protein